MALLQRQAPAFLLCLNLLYYGSAQETPAAFLILFDQQSIPLSHKAHLAGWEKEVNITKENDEAFIKAHLDFSKFLQVMQKEALSYLHNDSLHLTPDQTRQLTKIADIGVSAQTDEAKLKRLTHLRNEMEAIYSKAEVCIESDEKCLNLDPGLTQLMRESRDCEKLSAAWEGWRDQSGRKMKQLFPEYVRLGNEAIKILGHKDLAVYWKSSYHTTTFEQDVAKLFEQILPLYEQLHGYVRRKLRSVYGSQVFPSSGHIPGHLLGNMWAQSWNGVGEIVKPFKSKHSIDVTDEMINQGYTTRKMFETAEEFFHSLGFDNMTDIFWKKSMLERPEGRDVVCHASAWDMDSKDDFRIKMCTTINSEDLMTIHHEMGHIQYYMQYNHLPEIYRRGANPGFHEAVGDTIALSVQTPEHLQSIGLLKSGNINDKEVDINFLMQMALEKLAFLPFGYLIDQWRWSVFSGNTPPEKYNEDWWNLRCKLQGISPPVKRSSDDFDPGAKYHVPADVPYIRYFVSHVIQFQFYKAACDAAGNTKPLHHCDFYNNHAAGEKIKSMLQLGASKPWPEAMEKITGQRRMDAQPLLDYFQPLLDFLKKENGDDYGWDAECPEDPPPCRDGAETLELRVWVVLVAALLVIVTAALQAANQ